MYQPKTGEPCSCKRGLERDNCPTCEGTGMVINFAVIRAVARVDVAPEKLAEYRSNLTAKGWAVE